LHANNKPAINKNMRCGFFMMLPSFR